MEQKRFPEKMEVWYDGDSNDGNWLCDPFEKKIDASEHFGDTLIAEYQLVEVYRVVVSKNKLVEVENPPHGTAKE